MVYYLTQRFVAEAANGIKNKTTFIKNKSFIRITA